jgi:hypothetical protein
MNVRRLAFAVWRLAAGPSWFLDSASLPNRSRLDRGNTLVPFVP